MKDYPLGPRITLSFSFTFRLSPLIKIVVYIMHANEFYNFILVSFMFLQYLIRDARDKLIETNLSLFQLILNF